MTKQSKCKIGFLISSTSTTLLASISTSPIAPAPRGKEIHEAALSSVTYHVDIATNKLASPKTFLGCDPTRPTSISLRR
ncbi:hypothetical protein AN958_03167 [Leucoagaricus sp. SymC.cos]|nr:hypothetical protein AN958_03167 [Leucoagaricus sp. SymC.cos]